MAGIQSDSQPEAARRTLPRWAMAVFVVLTIAAGVQFLVFLPSMAGWPKFDFSAYYRAGLLVRAGNADQLYDNPVPTCLREFGYRLGPGPYIYPPPLAVVLSPLTLLRFPAASMVWFALGLALCIHLTWILVRAAPRPGLPATLLVLITFFCSNAILGDITLGNVNALVAWLVVLSLALVLRGRDGPAGAALAGAFLIKLTPALLLAYLAMTRRWRALVLFCTTAVLVCGATAAVTGPACFVRFLASFPAWSQREDIVSNQSLMGTLSRLLRGSAHSDAVIAWPAAVTPLWLAVSGAVLLVTMERIWRRRGDAFYCYGLVAVCTALVSPVTWIPHLVVLMIAIVWQIRAAVGTGISARPNADFLVQLLAFAAELPLLILSVPLNAERCDSNLLMFAYLSRPGLGLLVLWAALVHAGRRNSTLFVTSDAAEVPAPRAVAA